MKYKLLLGLAIMSEVTGVLSMKLQTSLGLVIMLCLVSCSYFIFSKAVKAIPLGIAYALWEGIGLIAITLLSIVLFHENISTQEMLGLAVLLAGILLVSHGSKTETKITTTRPATHKQA